MTDDLTTQSHVRTKLDVILEKCCWDIWAYVRERKMSLDSDLACKAIRSKLDGATKDIAELSLNVGKQVESLSEQLAEARELIRELNKAGSIAANRSEKKKVKHCG